ncbi:iron transporter, partial [Flavobacteriaceae bacterium]|nr:iron transporter [Flavobacteriaceae bacterium]
TPVGGFIPYLYISAQVINQKTGLSTFVDLLPHINLVDNFHYARNISLPGSVEDKYSVKFNITKPSGTDLALHMDWLKSYGKELLENKSFSYYNVDFSEVANANRD